LIEALSPTPITADKREIKDSPKFAYLLLFARGYTTLQKYQYQVIYTPSSIPKNYLGKNPFILILRKE